MLASCWSVSCCVCACAPRPIGHLGNAAFSSQLSVISANREGRANRDAFRGQLLVASPLEEKAELPQRHGGAEKKPIQAKKTRLLELCIFIRLLPLQIVTVIEIVALSDCVTVSAALASLA